MAASSFPPPPRIQAQTQRDEPALADRLAGLRGPLAPRHHDARTIAALTANPGCARRSVLDVAGVDKRALAERIGFGPRFGQSPFAIGRGNAFEKLVKADGGATLLGLLRGELGLDVATGDQVADQHSADQDDIGQDRAAETAGGGWVDLGTGDRQERYRRTRELVAAAARGSGPSPVLADHPMLRLEVAGRAAYVEPDLIAFRVRVGGRAGEAAAAAADGVPWRWYLAEIKSFAVIDGRADPMKVAEAATQAAVYVLAFQTLLAELGLPAGLVATDVALICPKDFSNTPTAALIDVRRQLAAVRRQLDRMPRVGTLLAGLDEQLSFDLSVGEDGEPVRTPADLGKAVASVEARYAPECISRCDMAFYCRDEARAAASTDLLGRAVRDALGGIGTMREVLALSVAGGGAVAGDAEAGAQGRGASDPAEAARLLSVARRARREALELARAREGGAAA